MQQPLTDLMNSFARGDFPGEGAAEQETESLPPESLRHDPGLAQLYRDYQTAKADWDRLARQYGRNHGFAVVAESQKDSLRRAYEARLRDLWSQAGEGRATAGSQVVSEKSGGQSCPAPAEVFAQISRLVWEKRTPEQILLALYLLQGLQEAAPKADPTRTPEPHPFAA